MKFTVAGLDKLQRQLGEARRAFEALDGEVANLSFNPCDPASVDAAVRKFEAAVDIKLGPYRGNSLVENVATQFKAKGRAEILERARSAAAEDDS